MIALVVVATVFAAQAPESPPPSPPPPPAEATPPLAPAPAPAAVEPSRVEEQAARVISIDRCLELLRAGQAEEAQRCYAEKASHDDSDRDAALARELADVVGALRLRPPTLGLRADDPNADPNADPTDPTASVQKDDPAGVDVARLVLSGRAELIATSTLIGGYVVTTAAVGGYALTCNAFGCGGPSIGLLFLAPVVGGFAGLGASTAIMLTDTQLTPGDVNAVRAIMLLGAFDSIMLPIHANATGFNSGNASAALLSLGMVVVQGAGIGAGALVAMDTDLHEGAGSFALSTGLWSSVLTVLAVNSVGGFKNRSANDIALVIDASVNLGFIGGMIASPYLPMSRAETWAIDIGGGVGLAAGASLAVFSRAPNPFLGYGTMAVGTAVGMGAGFMTARYLPDVVVGLPEIVALAPIAVPDEHGDLVTGAMVMTRF